MGVVLLFLYLCSLEKEREKQQKLDDYQKFLDEQRKIAEMRLQERMIVEKPGGGNYVGS